MPVKIRLTRIGSHKKPFYRVVVADSRAPRDGKFIEKIGTYDPFLEEDKFKINIDRLKYWVEVGAQPTDIVKSFIKKSTV